MRKAVPVGSETVVPRVPTTWKLRSDLSSRTSNRGRQPVRPRRERVLGWLNRDGREKSIGASSGKKSGETSATFHDRLSCSPSLLSMEPQDIRVPRAQGPGDGLREA